MKLNLGCGSKLMDGYINVDKFDYYDVDIVHDLEVFPYPWDSDSVDEIVLSHVLEHIGQNPDTFNSIVKELYRICKHGTEIKIAVPHPRHDDFISDPTHVRPITVLGLSLYDKDLNEQWAKQGAANTPLGLIHDVDFTVVDYKQVIESTVLESYKNGAITKEDLVYRIKHHTNVIKQIDITWKARKSRTLK